MPTTSARWSTPKFLAIAVVTALILIFVLNLVLNVVLALGVPSGAIAAAPAVVIALLLPRWRVVADRGRSEPPGGADR